MFSSKNLYVVAILLACGTIAVSAGDCPKACTLEFNQVCATNGKEYRLFDNPCVLDVFNCEHEFSWTRTKALTPCLADTASVSVDVADCIRPCGSAIESIPVCGFDGKHYRIFDNVCEMHNAECGTDKHYEEVKLYSCVPHPVAFKLCEKPCTFEYAPVCGFNGKEHKVFSNACEMENEHCKDNKVWKQTRMNECETEIIPVETDVNCEKPCTFEYMPVCGSNGLKTEVFPNKCALDNAHCKDGKKWTETTFTNCIEFAAADIVPKTNNCEKPCNKMLSPVCGFNGKEHKVFGNECVMENEHCKDGQNWSAAPMSTCEVATQVSLESTTLNNCIKPCNKMLAPVCGTDGLEYKVFSNQCVMENQHCYDNHKWSVASFSLCEPPQPFVQKECIKICPRIYAPVCGTDGQVYRMFDNLCLMEKEQECDGHHWSMTNFALCEENPIPLAEAPKKDIIFEGNNCIKPCNKMLAPVCGTDGLEYKVFSNQCVLENQHCYDNHKWSVASFSLCEPPQPFVQKECIKICPLIYAPVCGTDGQVYRMFDNLCLMEKEEECDGHHWSMTNFGLCEENPIPLAEAPKKDIIFEGNNCIKPCNKMLAPVCGTDGLEYKVFSNQCVMENQHCYDNHKWSVASFSLCEPPQPFVKKECIKICPRIYAPVCGTDGQVYRMFDNLCLMEKEQECDGHHWSMTNFGLCEENPIPLAEAPKKNCNKACPDNYDPICASNGKSSKTFANQCMLESYNCENEEHFVANFRGECESVQEKKNCQTFCPLIYAPICASNGYTNQIFSNKCELEAYNCFNNEHFVATLMANCEA